MRRKKTAFTLTEFVMAMAVVAIIGAAVAGVSMALSTAYAHSQGFYQYMQNGRMSILRIQTDARKAKLLTAATNTAAVFWLGDPNGDGQINLSEVMLLSYDSAAAAVKQYRVVFPTTMDAMTRAALDVPVALASLTSVSDVQTTLTRNVYCRTTVLADDVKYFHLSAKPAPPMSKMLTIDLAVGRDDNNLRLRSACALRADATQYVSTAGGVYVLDMPAKGY